MRNILLKKNNGRIEKKYLPPERRLGACDGRPGNSAKKEKDVA
ncbi:MAG: hypothetical protein ACO1O1_16560 [Adhaeribacter sp.]